MRVKTLLFRIGILCLLIGLCAITTFYSQTLALKQTGIQKYTYQNALIPEQFNDFKIGFISDFDISEESDFEHLKACIDKLNQQECDFVIFGGDMYDAMEIFNKDDLISLFKSIQAPYGKAAILGENDFATDLDKSIALLEKSGFEVLRNQAHYIYYKDAKITFAGLENSGKVDELLSEEQKNSFVFAAVHQPDYFQEVSTQNCSLLLAGHSGGGYISLPLIRGIARFDGCNIYNHGHYSSNSHDLYICNGIGMSHEQKARLNTMPGAMVITLKSTKTAPKPQPQQPEPEVEQIPEENENTEE